eukprot:15364713-Ditylum_brightwellii.AAC.1
MEHSIENYCGGTRRQFANHAHNEFHEGVNDMMVWPNEDYESPTPLDPCLIPSSKFPQGVDTVS